jgi:ubiquinone/menaquinone biosynthesis C-methylase UbiE
MKCRLIVVVVFLLIAPLVAQEKSVRPGVNQQFENPSAEEFVARFERDGRDAFDHRDAIVKAIGLKPGMTVADIGAGTGLFTRLFAKEVGPEGRIYAVDIARSFVDHIQKQADAAGQKNIRGVVCLPDNVNLPPHSIDLAYICDTYHHFEFPHKTMRSLHAALKPGGEIILIDFHRIEGKSSEWTLSHVRAGQEVFCREIVEAGFKQIEDRQDLLKESYFVRFAKAE